MTIKNDTQYFENSDYYFSKGASGVDFRAKNYDAIENLEKFIRFLCFSEKFYLQDRQQKFLIPKKLSALRMIVIGKKSANN